MHTALLEAPVTAPVTTSVITAPAPCCTSCGARLARDNTTAVCSPCRRRDIETAARRGSTTARARVALRAEFESRGLPGVATVLECRPEEAFDALVSAQILGPMPSRRRAILRRLAALSDLSHVAAASALELSRWTVASYRQELGIDPGRRQVRPRNW